MQTLGLIPARWASTRFLGKPLAKILDKPMIQWVYEACLKSSVFDYVAVATDDERIKESVESFGGQVVITSSDLSSGSDRVWEACQNFSCEIVVNIQGDEPLLRPEWLQVLVSALKNSESLPMATLCTDFKNKAEIDSSHVVKVVVNKQSEAIYFSRLPIPFHRENRIESVGFKKHIGIYAYRKNFLEKFCQEPMVALEQSEGLEQLRALYMGARLKVIPVQGDSCGVDLPEDIKKVEDFLNRK